jgi:hypothetical protein
MKLILALARAYHTPINVWLEMGIEDLHEWSMIAQGMIEEEEARRNVQKVGPGL